MKKSGDCFVAFSNLMPQLLRTLSALEHDEKICFGVTASQCCTFEILYEKGMLTMKELSASLGHAVSTVTRTLDVMVREGFVKRTHSSRDRRKVYVELTRQGRSLAEKLSLCCKDYCKEVFYTIPAHKHKTMVDSLQTLLLSVKQCTENKKRCNE